MYNDVLCLGAVIPQQTAAVPQLTAAVPQLKKYILKFIYDATYLEKLYDLLRDDDKESFNRKRAGRAGEKADPEDESLLTKSTRSLGKPALRRRSR